MPRSSALQAGALGYALSATGAYGHDVPVMANCAASIYQFRVRTWFDTVQTSHGGRARLEMFAIGNKWSRQARLMSAFDPKRTSRRSKLDGASVQPNRRP